MNGQGFKPSHRRDSRSFQREHVLRILRNPWYGGKQRAYGDVVDANHEPLLPWDEFERISARCAPRDPVAQQERKGGRPGQVALLSRVLFCGYCGHGIWHRRRRKSRCYQCGNGRHNTGLCDAGSFDARVTEEAVRRHLRGLFVDFDRWFGEVTQERAEEREQYEQALAGIRDERKHLDRRERRVRQDYRSAEDGDAARILLKEVRAAERDREHLDCEEREVEEALGDHDRMQAADEMLDWWNDLHAAIQKDVLGAPSVEDANRALRTKFAAIFVTFDPDGDPYLDFVLRDREPGAPLVAASLWGNEGYQTPPSVQTGTSTLV